MKSPVLSLKNIFQLSMRGMKTMLLESLHKTVLFIGKVEWPLKSEIEPQHLESLYQVLRPEGYIILTMRRNHLSTIFTNLVHFIMTGKRGFYSHALINTQKDNDFTLIEATGEGVKHSQFSEVFNCHAVAVLKPKSRIEWHGVTTKALSAIGKPYNSLFTLCAEEAATCATLVRHALMASPNYHYDFSHLEGMAQKYKKLTPQMFYDCPDFEIVYEVRC